MFMTNCLLTLPLWTDCPHLTDALIPEVVASHVFHHWCYGVVCDKAVSPRFFDAGWKNSRIKSLVFQWLELELAYFYVQN